MVVMPPAAAAAVALQSPHATRPRTEADSALPIFAPGFVVEHFVKDMGIALAEAKRMNLALPGLALAEQLYLALVAQGGGRRGTHALVQALARLSNLDWG